MGRHRHPGRTSGTALPPHDPGLDDDRVIGQVAAGRELIAVLDSGGISALSPTSERNRARLRAMRERVADITMPAAVLAEGVLSGHPGRDYHVRRLLDIIDTAPVDENLGMAAGILRSEARRDGADPPPSGVEAIVVAYADTRATNSDVTIVTSDPADITALAAHTQNGPRLAVQAV